MTIADMRAALGAEAVGLDDAAVIQLWAEQAGPLQTTTPPAPPPAPPRRSAAAGRLTMRATVQRRVAGPKDRWGKATPGALVDVDVLPCFVWSSSSREIVDGDKAVTVEDVRGMFAIGADLLPGDEIAAVTDRLGRVVFPGRLRVEGPVQTRATHAEATLQRIG